MQYCGKCLFWFTIYIFLRFICQNCTANLCFGLLFMILNWCVKIAQLFYIFYWLKINANKKVCYSCPSHCFCAYLYSHNICSCKHILKKIFQYYIAVKHNKNSQNKAENIIYSFYTVKKNVSISTALFIYFVMKMHQDGLKITNHILLQSCVYCLRIIIKKMIFFLIQWQLDAFVHIMDLLERHKLVLLRVRFGLSVRAGMNETYITRECLRWRVLKLKYRGRIYVRLN